MVKGLSADQAMVRARAERELAITGWLNLVGGRRIKYGDSR
jgi:hypothetical protein